MPRTLLVLALVLLVLSGCTAGTHRAGSAQPTGRWAGLASQFDSGDVRGTPDSQWTVEVTLGETGRGETARIAYPSLGCAGTLTYRGQAPSGAAVYAEAITSGKDRCVVSGTVELLPDGDRLHYSARHESQPSVSVGLLTRP